MEVIVLPYLTGAILRIATLKTVRCSDTILIIGLFNLSHDMYWSDKPAEAKL